MTKKEDNMSNISALELRENVRKMEEELITFTNNISDSDNIKIFRFDNCRDDCIIEKLNPPEFYFCYYKEGKWNRLPKIYNSITNAKNLGVVELYCKK